MKAGVMLADFSTGVGQLNLFDDNLKPAIKRELVAMDITVMS
jgi:hypothetical protein